MDDREGQIFIRICISNTTLQLSFALNCKGGKEKLTASGLKHHTVKGFMEKWRQSSIDN
jgi:hypothetical protein